MINPGKSLPLEEVDEWPEIFKEVTLNVLPIQYVQAVRIWFNDGIVWEIGLDKKSSKKEQQSFHSSISQLLHDYHDLIDKTDFQINTKKVRQDVERSIKKMLRKTNLCQ